MGAPPGSQVAPLPRDLPFRLVSKTIGSGAYASIRKAVPLGKTNPVIAVKFINKEHAFSAGRLRPKQLEIELSLHASVCKPQHQNIIRYLSHGQDPNWVWMGLELAEGGDLFDKIEADEGVGEDVAHFYFTQLVSAIDWCHKKGVAHRDIKPENMLLSAEGNLKLADFGLATQFISPKSGERKVCGMVCGSPPYIAPEIIAVGYKNQKRKNGEDKVGYDPQIADVWSCAIVLFVLLVGNTPWDAPVMDDSYEYHDYVTSKGRPSDELWTRIPTAALSLVRGLLNIESTERLTLDQARQHPWFTRPNPHLSKKGTAANPMALATQMLESLRIDFSAPVQSSQRHSRNTQSQGEDAMDVDSEERKPAWTNLASTQPETPIADIPFDWEAPPRLGSGGISASQPQTSSDRVEAEVAMHQRRQDNNNRPTNAHLYELFNEDPSMSQFSATPSVPLTLTQQARRFADIVPAHSLARFISPLKIPQLLPMLVSALHRLNIPIATQQFDGKEQTISLRIKAMDASMQPMTGMMILDSIEISGDDGRPVNAVEVRFNKAKGDPVGWRRLFKQVAVLCKEAILRPGEPMRA